MNRLRILDGWRGLAILAVLAGHFGHVPFLSVGRLGVELFFVLSGRLMGDILFVRKEALRRFYWRRFTRIVPTLYVFLLLCYFISQYVPPGLQADLRLQPGSALASATFTYNYLHLWGYGKAVVDHVWSLCVEEHTYATLGLLAFIAMRTRISPWKACFVLAGLCMLDGFISTYALGQGYYEAFWRTDTRATGILLGCGVYCCAAENPQRFDWVDGRMLLLLLLMGLCLSLYPVPDPVKYSAGTAVLAIVVVFLDRLPAFARALLENRLLGFFGLASFSLYIYQQPFFQLVPVWGAPLMLAAALACGLASFFLVEGPARCGLNRMLGETARPVAVAAPVVAAIQVVSEELSADGRT